MKLTRLLLIIFAFSGVILNCRGPQSSTQNLPIFRLGVVSWIGYGPAYVGVKRKLFEQEGVRVEIKRIEDTGQLRAALVSKEVDAIIGTADSLASGAAAGLPAKVVLEVDESFGSDALVVGNAIKSFRDLRGKQIAFAQGLPSHFFLLTLLQEEGLSSSDIRPVYMEAPEAGAAFVAERVDAAVTWEPWVTQALKRNGAHTLFTSRTHPGIIVDLIAVHSDVARTRATDVCAFLRGWFRSVDQIRTDPEGTHTILANSFGVPRADVASMLNGLRFASLEDNRRFFGLDGGSTVPFVALFDRAGATWQHEHLIERAADGKTFFDPAPIRALRR
jgi:NitT/TauT family transport system substrate-binding protein